MKVPTSILDAWGSTRFPTAVCQWLESLPADHLPLQQGLQSSSHVADTLHRAICLHCAETGEQLQVKLGILYAGIVAGSCCADDPTPMCEQPEYCEVLLRIGRSSGDCTIEWLG